MFYFIPAWYPKERPWYDGTAPWFRVFERMSFDDTVNQLKMFQNAAEASCLVLLNYQPQLRYFLHKQDLLDTPYWSFFDDIQTVSRVSTHPLSFKELNWPRGTRFLYSPFAVVAQKGDETLATIHFAENGNLFTIDWQKEGHLDKQYVFDDRGFISSILYHNDMGQPLYQDYLNPNGVWQVREHLGVEKRGIEVNGYADGRFDKRWYVTWEELLQERLGVLKREVITAEDVLVLASHAHHNDLLLESFPEQQKVVSFFADRYDTTRCDLLAPLAQAATLLVVDTKQQEHQLLTSLEELGSSSHPVSRISPFDTRLRLGHSQMVKELILYFHIDGLLEEEVKAILSDLLILMDQEALVELRLVTFQHQYPLAGLKEWVEQEISRSFELAHFFQVVEGTGENELEEEEELELTRIRFDCFSNESQVIEALDTARLVLDLGPEPDLYTQIASISAGIPQIHRVETEYVTHLKNGWVLGEGGSLLEALHYYLDGLANWNAALVYAVQKMADYTSGRILSQWKDLLEQES
ncbi:accessory Sec system protein Asp1 [Streptococcus cuniculi]|uniref:Accessory Sec system protein Asp1 n=1 Tax=Streptococcus cuniculi TaxID=1432788 RepID=A0A4Y9JBN9_9STRE|nr:accessory Sec system protein Asp1 [Streptococcus cuniculi]MBF0778472.1 accessory Sec system protein Asp1 [Streptococcus cuniculi]TFU97568.1 accessory Sec system protein Asp1 [Streptococcus cuniculi]